jgi:hypothetical protein
MAENETTIEMVGRVEREVFQKLYDRMDKHRKLYTEPYVLTDGNGNKLPGQISVTMNDPGVFLNAVQSWIISATWQTVVEGSISSRQQTLIESFLDDREAMVEERLANTEFGRDKYFTALNICSRGWIASRRIWQTDKDGNPYLEVIPIDCRYLSYERYGQDYDWVNVRWARSRGSVLRDYGINLRPYINEVEVCDYWDGQKEEIWIDGKVVKINKHQLEYPPFVIIPAPEGFMQLDKGYLVDKGQSIFFLDEKMYPEWNRIISIDQSLAMLALAPPYQRVPNKGEPPSPYPNEPATTYDVPPAETPNQPNLYQKIEQPDINMANRMSHNEIGTALMRGGVNNLDLGSLDQPATAIWITEQTEIRNKILSPRLKAIEDYKVACARMDIKQYQQGHFDGKIGRFGKQKEYIASQMGDPSEYTINYESMTRTRKQEIANIAMFNSATGLSMETRLRDILRHQDPVGEIARIEGERAEQADPVLFYFRKARSLAREAEGLEGIDADAKNLESMRMTKLGTDLILQGAMMPQAGQAGGQGQGNGQYTQIGAQPGNYMEQPNMTNLGVSVGV